MTLAPENDVENALTTYCHEHDVVISIGHTAATYEQAMAAVEAGAKVLPIRLMEWKISVTGNQPQ